MALIPIKAPAWLRFKKGPIPPRRPASRRIYSPSGKHKAHKATASPHSAISMAKSLSEREDCSSCGTHSTSIRYVKNKETCSSVNSRMKVTGCQAGLSSNVCGKQACTKANKVRKPSVYKTGLSGGVSNSSRRVNNNITNPAIMPVCIMLKAHGSVPAKAKVVKKSNSDKIIFKNTSIEAIV